MLFEDTIHINAPCEAVYGFFEHMDKNYLDWHPEHKAFEWRKGAGLKIGNVFYFEENIAGELLKKETRFTEIKPNAYIAFTMVSWFYRWFIPKMTFVFTPQEHGCLFTAQIFLRGIGPLGKWSHRKEFAAVKQHMKEEGENLKRMIETQSYVY